ncbi:MAG: sortase [Eubacteriales bacterium]|nr:sortase [Eubacteriales bacterium]
MKNKRDGNLLKILGLLLIVAALSLAGYSLWGEYRAERNADAALAQVEAVLEPSVEPETGALEAAETKAPIPEYVTNPDMPMPEREIDGELYIGVVEIPSLSLSLPVIGEWSDERLKTAPCRYVGSAYTKDLIISGHSYKKHFRYIRKLAVGDRVTFTDMDGNRFIYEVSGTEVVDGSDAERMVAGDWDLTLFTCTYNGSARHAVRCREVEE